MRLKHITRIELTIAAITGLAILAIFSYYFAVLKVPLGLKFTVEQTGQQSGPADREPTDEVKLLDSIDPASLTVAFGLKYLLPATASTEIPTISTVASETDIPEKPIVNEPDDSPANQRTKEINLEALGYRLKGIILEGQRSAAFIQLPKENRTVVVRENAPGDVRLLKAGLRSVVIATPEGNGVLELEYSRISQMSSNIDNQSSISEIVKQKAEDRPLSGPDSIAELMKQGNLSISKDRTGFFVEVKKLPKAFDNYPIIAGDRIIGADNTNFLNSGDVANQLGVINSRAISLKIRRGNKIMMLQPINPVPFQQQPSSCLENASASSEIR